MKRLLLFLILATQAQAAITRTQQVSAAANNVAITSATAGDYIVVYSYDVNTTTIPTLPAGFTDIVGTAGTAQAARLGYKVAVGGETSSGTWTNGTQTVCHVYRGMGGFGTTPTLNPGNGTTLTYLAVTLQDASGTSWVAAFGGSSGATAGMGGTPTGTAPNLVAATNSLKANGLDTNTGVTSFTAQTLTVTGSGRWFTATIELKVPVSGLTAQQKAAFLQFFPTIMFKPIHLWHL